MCADFYLRARILVRTSRRLAAPAKYYLLLVNNNNKKAETQKEKEEERLVEETAARQKVPAMYRALGRPHFIARLHRRRCARATRNDNASGLCSYFL